MLYGVSVFPSYCGMKLTSCNIQGDESEEDKDQYDSDNDDIWEELDASKRAKAKKEGLSPGKLLLLYKWINHESNNSTRWLRT